MRVRIRVVARIRARIMARLRARVRVQGRVRRSTGTPLRSWLRARARVRHPRGRVRHPRVRVRVRMPPPCRRPPDHWPSYLVRG